MASKARELANLGNAYSDGALSNRNLIINGAMQVAQRGTSFTNNSASFTYKLDRFVAYNAGGSTVTYTQETDAPDDFKYSIKATIDVAGAPDQQYFLTSFEGLNMAQLNFGSTAAKTITLSFWVKASITGTYNIALRSHNASLGGTFVKEYTVNSANTWEYKAVTITGRESGTWATDNTNWGYLFFNFSIGTAFDDGVDGEWVNSDERGTTNQVQLVETQGATFQITGVQLEVGDTATPFEHRSYGQELALCQRYYLNNGPLLGFWTDPDEFRQAICFPVEMRASPTMSIIDTNGYHEYMNLIGYNGISNIPFSARDTMGADFRLTSSSNRGRTYGNPSKLNQNVVSFDAEL